MAIETLRPNAPGNYSQSTIGGSAPAPTRWESVDEVVADDGVTLVYLTAPGYAQIVYDSYQKNSFTPAYASISSVKVYYRIATDNPGYAASYGRAFLLIGGTKYFEPTYQNPSDSSPWTTYSYTWSTNPATGLAWTASAINSMEVGIELWAGYSTYYDTRGTVWCTQEYIEVDYTPAVIGFHAATAQRRYKAATFSGFSFPDPAGTGFTAVTDGYSMLAGWGLVGAFKMLLSGTLYTAGSLGRNIKKSLSGSLTSSGTVSYLFRFYKVLYGTLNFSGSLQGLRIMLLGGVLNLSGTLNRLIKKGLSATLNLTGVLSGVLTFYKSLAGTLNFSGALASFLKFSKALAGTLNLSGSLIKLAKKNLAGVLNSSGTLGRKIFKKLSGTLTSTGVLSYGIGLVHKALVGTLNLSGSLNRKIKHGLSGALSLTGSLGFNRLRILAVMVAIKQYRNIEIAVKQYRIVKIITKQYRRIKNFILGGG